MTQTPPSKPGTPVVGFNHNINYQDRVFHIQTEDSGAQHAHVITHVYMGGNILRSQKTAYHDLVQQHPAGELAGAVRKLMEDQHKSMMKTLKTGGYDEEIAKRTGGKVYEPGVLAGGERAAGLLVGGENAGSKKPELRAAPAVAAKPPAPPPVLVKPPVVAAVPAAAPAAATAPKSDKIPKGPALPSSMMHRPNGAVSAPAQKGPPSVSPHARPLDEVVLQYLLRTPQVPQR